MSNSFEYEGKNVDDALEKASRALKIPKDKIQYTVTSYGSTGIFGLVGVKKAKIRVKSPHEKKDAQKASVLSIVDEAFGVTEKKMSGSPKPKTEKKKVAQELERKQQSADQENQELPEREEEGKAPKTPVRRKSPKKNKGKTVSGKEKVSAQEKKMDVEELSEVLLSSSEDTMPADAMNLQPDTFLFEDALQGDSLPLGPGDEEEDRPLMEPSSEMVTRGREVLEKIFSCIGEDVCIESEISGGRILYNLKCPDAAIIIGKRGQTLEALQYIVDKILNRDKEGRVRIQIDVEGYIETRKAQLRQLALRQAEKAKKTGKPATIGQLSAYDRRIIHLALKDDRNVRTQSVGEGFYRRLVIFPKKNGKKRGPNKGNAE